ncbi:hypothetical protein Q2T43_14870 [Aeromonas veronii]|uniref:hypothetical protein n=1 Tax=Aeromonas TaxID=642 RepID=UPI001C22E23C|nr:MULTISPECIES: hypothetical protein [Aeromonas]MDO2437486.1 hypothetical protein [Aeromonas veronii]QWZ87259.1 hypothetical protein I6L34_10685 [Aeromonas sp. FDAARGOS 1404]
MNELKQLLKNAGIKRALVVDDAFDTIPTAYDMAVDVEAWTRFFEDITEIDHEVLEEVYPGYTDTDADELKDCDNFVEAVWKARARLSEDPVNALFLTFESSRKMDLLFASNLLQTLSNFGIECEGCGRQFKDKATAAQLIFVDLFLNAAQREEDMNLSIEGVRQVIEGRPNDHPLVVLMSRSSRLPELRAHFQERTKLFETNFRIVTKLELNNPDTVARLLIRLGTHYEDSKKLLAFVNAWEDGLLKAKDNMMLLIRKIGLSDIARIHQLLLSTEGEPPGSYLVDIFDKVLQHEIEGLESIIDAAKVMNTLGMESYPPPFVPGEKDLQDFVQRCLFQNRARLSLSASVDSKIAFGDLLQRKKPDDAEINGEIAPAPHDPLSEVDYNMVAAVLTPACDLQRKGSKRVLLLVGALKPLTAADWSYKDEGARTPVIELGVGSRFWIKWDLKHIETLTHHQLESLLSPAGAFDVVARLRESHALELQQKLLSTLGRIGLVAPLPATFNMRIEAFLPNIDGVLTKANISTLDDGGVCFIGRDPDGKKSEERLILTENACEAVWTYVSSVDPETIHPRTRALVKNVKFTPDILQTLEQGLTLPTSASSFKEIMAPSGKTVGIVKRSKIETGEKLESKYLPKAAIVLSIYTPKDPEQQDTEETAIGNTDTGIVTPESGLENASPDLVIPAHDAEIKPVEPAADNAQ